MKAAWARRIHAAKWPSDSSNLESIQPFNVSFVNKKKSTTTTTKITIQHPIQLHSGRPDSIPTSTWNRWLRQSFTRWCKREYYRWIPSSPSSMLKQRCEEEEEEEWGKKKKQFQLRNTTEMTPKKGWTATATLVGVWFPHATNGGRNAALSYFPEPYYSFKITKKKKKRTSASTATKKIEKKRFLFLRCSKQKAYFPEKTFPSLRPSSFWLLASHSTAYYTINWCIISRVDVHQVLDSPSCSRFFQTAAGILRDSADLGSDAVGIGFYWDWTQT